MASSDPSSSSSPESPPPLPAVMVETPPPPVVVHKPKTYTDVGFDHTVPFLQEREPLSSGPAVSAATAAIVATHSTHSTHGSQRTQQQPQPQQPQTQQANQPQPQQQQQLQSPLSLGEQQQPSSTTSRSSSNSSVSGPRVISSSYAKSGWVGFAIASAGPALACLASNPFDVAKTRMQLQNELQPHDPARYRFSGSWDCLYKTYQAEGVKGLQRGLSIAIVREGSKNLFRIGLFHPVLSRMDPEPHHAPIWKRMVAGGVSGAVAAVICNPIEVIKTRMQSQGFAGKTSVGFQHGYTGIRHAATTIYHKDGPKVFFKGTSVSTIRSVLATAVNLTVFSSLRDLTINRGWAKDSSRLDAGCSAIAAVCAVLVQHPVDLVRTRVYNRDFVGGKGTMYPSALAACGLIVRTEGLRGMYKGLESHLMRTVPHFVLSFVFMGEMGRLAIKYAQKAENDRFAKESGSNKP